MDVISNHGYFLCILLYRQFYAYYYIFMIIILNKILIFKSKIYLSVLEASCFCS